MKKGVSVDRIIVILIISIVLILLVVSSLNVQLAPRREVNFERDVDRTFDNIMNQEGYQLNAEERSLLLYNFVEGNSVPSVFMELGGGSCEEFYAADVNDDGIVNVQDIVIVLLGWGGPGADVNGDGVVDIQDVVELLLQWGDFGGSGDINGDGVVDSQDVADLILQWGDDVGEADVNGDGIVDTQDIVLVILNWGDVDVECSGVVVIISTEEEVYGLGETVLLTGEPVMTSPPISRDSERRGSSSYSESAAGGQESITGIFSVFHEDLLSYSEIEYYPILIADNGGVYRLNNLAQDYVIGDKLVVSGNFFGVEINVESVEYLGNVYELQGYSSLGEQRLLVLLGRNPESEEIYSVEEVEQVIFDEDLFPSVNSFFKEASYDQTWFTGDVYGWYVVDDSLPGAKLTVNGGEIVDERTVHLLFSGDSFEFSDGSVIEIINVVVDDEMPNGGSVSFEFLPLGSEEIVSDIIIDNEVYVIDGIEYEIDLHLVLDNSNHNYPVLSTMAAADSDVDFTQYDRILVGWRGQHGVAWGGLVPITFYTYDGEISLGTATSSGMNLDGFRGIADHEIGHTFNLLHANGWECGSEMIGDVCDSIAYANTFDVMGGGSNIIEISGHFNSYHKEKIGWFRYFETIEVNNNGIYSIYPIEISEIQPKNLKISYNEGNDYYYLEYRRPIGYDAHFIEEFDNEEIFDGIFISFEEFSVLGDSQLIDGTPHVGEGVIAAKEDFEDSALLLRESFVDDENGVAVTTIYVGDDRAKVYVSDREESLVFNYGGIVETGELSIGVQRFESGIWENYELLVDSEEYSIIPEEVIELYGIFNEFSWSTDEVGSYRIWVEFSAEEIVYSDEYEFYVSFCGNDVIEINEECEGLDLNGETCETLGYIYGGELGCNVESCQFDVSMCSGANRIFVTTGLYDGNLGGIDGANDLCQSLAENAEIDIVGTTWKAWLSTTESNVAERFEQSSLPYTLVDGTIIVNNWDDLVTCGGPGNECLQHRINMGPGGNLPIGSSGVWTGTDSEGSVVLPNCEDWESSEFGLTGVTGSYILTDGGWTDSEFENYLTCAGHKHLYCFEQPI